MPTDAVDHDFFISRRGSHAGVAQEVLDALVEGGWERSRILVQDKDLPPGVHFLDWMHRNLHRARHLIVVLSADYDDSPYTRQYEFLTFLAEPGTGTEARRVIVLRAQECQPPGLMRGFVYQDLVGVSDPNERQQLILDAAEGRVAPVRGTARVFAGVPDRLPYFAGRDELLRDLHRKLTRPDDRGADGPGAGEVAVTEALAGMGGVGKTVLAAEYAHRYAAGYAGVWWAPAEQRELLIASLAQLAGRLDASWRAAQDQAAAARAALELLRQRGALVPWLLVYDNVETPEAIDGLRPPAGAHLLATTRFPNWPGAHTDVGTFDRAVSVAFLQERADRPDQDGADRLAEKLGDLPLALDHAAAFCAEAALSFDQYAAHLDTFLAEKPEGAGYHGHAEATVHGTFAAAMARAEAQCKEAGELIELLSVLGAEPVPLDLFDDALPMPQRARAVQALTRVALVRGDTAETGAPAVTLHRLVARVARIRADAAGRLDAAVARATEILAEAFPTDAYREPAQWPRCAVLLPHVLALRAHWSQERETVDAAHLANRAGGYLRGRASFEGAEELSRNAVTVARRVLTATDPELATFANNLALVLKGRGKLDEAEPLYREAIQIGEAAYGCDHPEVAVWRNNLASLLYQRGKLDEAEPLYREAIRIGEATTGRNHPQVAIRLNNLAELLYQRGKLDEAEPLYREALRISEASYGRNHPSVAIRLNNLANLLGQRGKLDEAEPLFREAIAIDEAAYGRDHPEVATDLNNLANLLRQRGKLDEAEPLYREALAAFEAALGAEHPHTTGTAHNLAGLLDDAGRAAEAADLRRRYPRGDGV